MIVGIYVNPGNDLFAESVATEIYVDKTNLISYINRVLGTEEKYICVSKPRRFGKTMAAKMLAAYYDYSVDSAPLFKGLTIEKDPSFWKHLGRYNVLFINMLDFLTEAGSVDRMLIYL